MDSENKFETVENVSVFNQARKSTAENDEVKKKTEPQEEVKEEVVAEKKYDVSAYVPSRVTSENYLSSGVTLLNLATTNDPDCFVEKGTYDLFVGTSGSGKSFLAMQLLAEASINPSFDNYELVYDDAENGALFDVERLFGSRLAKRLRAPRYTDEGLPIYSATVEDFFFNIDDLQKERKSFVYILDSMDSLTSSPADMKFEENKDTRRTDLEKGKQTSELTQGYGDGKAKLISGYLRRVVNRLAETGSILIIISQVRENITGYGAKYTRSGGQALKFFAHEEYWFDSTKKLVRTIEKKDRQYGQVTKVEVKKNRITGYKMPVEFPILLGTGISDCDACLDWLCNEGRIVKPSRSNGLYEFQKLGLKANREEFIRKMEEDFTPFKEEMMDLWYSILRDITPKRKRKYE